jgi:hypothetical protein
MVPSIHLPPNVLERSGDIAVPEQALGKSNKYRKPIPGTATASAALPPVPRIRWRREDYEPGINKCISLLKLLMSQFLTHKSVFKLAGCAEQKKQESPASSNPQQAARLC